MFNTAASALFVVLAEPPAEREEEFHEWYDKVHGPDAIDNGSFRALHRYRATGPGWKQARYLALWEGNYLGEPEAWAYIRPRAEQLRASGRVGDVASVQWALMMFAVATAAGPNRAPAEPVGRSAPTSLTTVQNDWRHPDPEVTAGQWWEAMGLEYAPPVGRAALYTSDPDGSGGGYHLAAFEHGASLDEAAAGWGRFGAAGMSPTPPYRTIFVTEPPAPDPPPDGARIEQSTPPGPAPAWVMHWEHVASLT